ncbi:TPA: transcriptional regulator [Escherichia fergusonii]|nr:transcription proteincastor [Escherichia fergusonii B253]PQI94434.1 transcriptional regulator [Escherichia fergusonii]PQJ02595.1 transcriptional regulator [Escherichia fergusonii]RSK74538.1 transcriptional regulator [Escherichia fergusonii]HAJ6530239.1 transcriptional regulator [Escherichia fergusonii]
MLKTRKKAPFQVLFCGLLQSLTSPGIDPTCRNWYLT